MFFRKKTKPTKTQAIAEDDTLVIEDTIKVVEEQVEVGKRNVVGDTVRIHTLTNTENVPIEAQLRVENYNVERIPHDTLVTSIPQVRKEGGVTIIPVLEERIRVVKEIVLKEEIHLIPHHDVVNFSDVVERRVQDAVVERVPVAVQAD